MAALGIAASATRALEAQTVSDTTRFFPGFKSFKVQTSGAEINGVVGGQGPPILLLHAECAVCCQPALTASIS